MSNEDKELIDQCVKIQLNLGIDDIKWKQLAGNEKGLYGFISQHYIDRKGLLKRVKDYETTLPESYSPIEAVHDIRTLISTYGLEREAR